jgi:hypothetical protein
VVVVLSSRHEDSGFAKVYERQREAPESVALGDLPDHVMTLLGEGGAAPDSLSLSTTHRELSKSNSTCSTSDTNANISSGGASSSSIPSSSSSSSSSSAAVMKARLVVSPGLFSAKDPRREVYRKRSLIEDKLASLLQSLFVGTVFTVVAGDESADNSNSNSNSNNNDGTGLVAGPAVFAANTSLANLQLFHSVLTERVAAGAGTARTLDLETFAAAAATASSSSASSSSEAVAREQRQWLKPLLSYLRGSHGEGGGLFLYSIPDDDCVVLHQRILAS